jgi:L-ascorbate metabolism protein UlaG (beta-lactamase superfamily)
MKKMTKEEFDLAISNLEDERNRILGEMIELADKVGFSFSCDAGGHNEYYPEGTKECEDCDEGMTSDWIGYMLPDGSTTTDFPGDTKYEHVYGPPYACGECNGTGRIDVEYSGWQRSYC